MAKKGKTTETKNIGYVNMLSVNQWIEHIGWEGETFNEKDFDMLVRPKVQCNFYCKGIVALQAIQNENNTWKAGD